jgi:acetylglutamate kinase
MVVGMMNLVSEFTNPSETDVSETRISRAVNAVALCNLLGVKVVLVVGCRPQVEERLRRRREVSTMATSKTTTNSDDANNSNNNNN